MVADRSIAEILHSIGISPKYKGYYYLLYVLECVRANPEYLYSSSVLYAKAIQHFGVSRKSIERNIRFAIGRAWDNPTNPHARKLFEVYAIDYAPTTREFISIIIESICFRHFSSLHQFENQESLPKIPSIGV